MKSERPQIHESNLLADKVESFFEKVRDRLPAIIAAIVFLAVGLIGWGIYKSVQNTQAATAWSALYFSDTDTEDLDSIGKDFAGSKASNWAYQAAGDAHLAKGGETVFVNRDIADQHYEKAVGAYEMITGKDAGRVEDSFIMSRAYYGKAQAFEGLGKREEAVKAYRKIAEQRDQSAGLNMTAAKRADWLESREGEEFYTWYKANRQSAPTVAPTGERPALPDAPTFDLSGLPPATPVEAVETVEIAADEAGTAPQVVVPNPDSSATESDAVKE